MMAQVLAAERRKPQFGSLARVATFDHESLAEQDELEGFLNADKDSAASELDRELLSLLVADRIQAFKTKLPQMRKTMQQIYNDLVTTSNSSKIAFEFAPAKDHTRAFAKLLDDVSAEVK